MVLVDQEVICGLAKHSKFVETTLRKVLRVLADDRVGVTHDSGSQHMPVILIGNTIDCS